MGQRYRKAHKQTERARLRQSRSLRLEDPQQPAIRHDARATERTLPCAVHDEVRAPSAHGEVATSKGETIIQLRAICHLPAVDNCDIRLLVLADYTQPCPLETRCHRLRLRRERTSLRRG